jgi:hypothetical protein
MCGVKEHVGHPGFEYVGLARSVKMSSRDVDIEILAVWGKAADIGKEQSEILLQDRKVV